MKILTRYLAWELIKPFCFCLLGCSALWIIADLFDTLDDFIEAKTSAVLIVDYYFALYPRLLLEILPVSVLVATLVLLLNLGRNRETVALQAAGVGPSVIFRPFVVLALVCGLLLSFLLARAASQSQKHREEIMKNVRGVPSQQNMFGGVVYRDYPQHVVWYSQLLEIKSATATNVEVLLQNEQGEDLVKYFAESAAWDGRQWTLHRVREYRPNSTPGTSGSLAPLRPAVILPNLDLPPARLTAIQEEPEQMTRSELNDFLQHSSHLSSLRLAPYRTQWHHGLAYALTPLLLTLFGAAFAFNITRRTATTAVAKSIAVLLLFFFVSKFFLALGRSDRLPALLAAWTTPLSFLSIALLCISPLMGWFPSRR